MTQEEWCRAYEHRLVEKGGINYEQAFDIMSKNYDEFDYTQDPIEAADEEMNYWAD